METQPKLGMNRTGVAMSPIDTEKMLTDTNNLMGNPGAPRLVPSPIRDSYFAEAGTVGSIPLPLTIKGVVESGKALLTGEQPQVLIDRLGERLAFERGGVRIYQAMLSKCAAKPEILAQDVLDRLQHIQEEELEHFQIIHNALRSLGADPTAVTPCADLVGVQTMGLMQAITDPRTTILQSLNVLLSAELLDVPAWEDLVALTQALGHDDLAAQFAQALAQENTHLSSVRGWYSQMTLSAAQLGVATLGRKH